MDAPGPGALSEARLRAAGVRVTRPRLAVLDAVEGLGGHRGVDENTAPCVTAPVPGADVDEASIIFRGRCATCAAAAGAAEDPAWT